MDSESDGGLQRLRVSDAERDAVVARLNDATGEGRLTLEEFSERVSAALAARTQGDLDVLVDDLPKAGTAVAARPPAAVAPVPVAVAHITPIGAVKRSGRWRLDRDQQLGTVLGTVKLDLRQAEFAAPTVSLRVQTVVGAVKIWVLHGVTVEVEGHTVVGTRSIVDDVPGRPGAPVLRLRVDTVVGSVKVYRG